MTVGSKPNVRDVMQPVVQTAAYILNFDTLGASSGVRIGTLPADAVIQNWQVRVLTAFNAGTTNPITIGTTATGAEIMAAASISDYDTASNTVGDYWGAPATSTGWAQFSDDQEIYAAYIPTGTSATTGKAVIFVNYISLVAANAVQAS